MLDRTFVCFTNFTKTSLNTRMMSWILSIGSASQNSVTFYFDSSAEKGSRLPRKSVSITIFKTILFMRFRSPEYGGYLYLWMKLNLCWRNAAIRVACCSVLLEDQFISWIKPYVSRVFYSYILFIREYNLFTSLIVNTPIAFLLRVLFCRTAVVFVSYDWRQHLIRRNL